MSTASLEPPSLTPSCAAQVLVTRANLYLSREVCDAYLMGLQSVALLRRDEQVLIVPLMPDSAGGLLLKTRNGRGDRVIHAQEFFREHGYVEDFTERICTMIWNPDLAALVIADLPRV